MPLDYQTLIKAFKQHGQPDKAEEMMAYMKHQFEFYGLPAPLRRELQKPYLRKDALPKITILPDIILELWELDYRECQYFAIDLLRKYSTKVGPEFINLYEKIITQKSWWDSVDLIASSLVGDICQQHPELIPNKMEAWINDDNMWLQRSAIIFQLKYKEHTDFELLKRFIRKTAHSEEFFIQKAIGWALREYSKTNPNEVSDFIASENLAKLSIREGSKYLK